MRAILFDRPGEPEQVLQLVAVPAERLIPVPQDIPDATACQISLEAILSNLWDLIRRDALPLPIDATFALADFRQALAADAQPGRRGKILLT